jgi:hypothetical protein
VDVDRVPVGLDIKSD